MPGPITDCCMSTGPTPALRISSIASGSSRFSARMKSARVIMDAAGSRFRQTRTMEDARALSSLAQHSLASSVRTGHVPSITDPASTTA